MIFFYQNTSFLQILFQVIHWGVSALAWNLNTNYFVYLSLFRNLNFRFNFNLYFDTLYREIELRPFGYLYITKTQILFNTF